MLKVYFKPNCATCQTALSLLKKETDEDLELIEYLVETPTQKEIKEILKMLGMKAEDLVRKKEHLYNYLELKEGKYICRRPRINKENDTRKLKSIILLFIIYSNFIEEQL